MAFEDISKISPTLVAGVLLDSFPGVTREDSDAIGRRRVFRLSFSEFTLTVTTPVEQKMKGKTTVTFRRAIQLKKKRPQDRDTTLQVFNISKTFKWDQGEAFVQEIHWARGYVMGIVMALSAAFESRIGSPLADIFGGQ